jgi:peptidoglycan/LPS O-acetylase OafA/YrhL
MKKIKKNRIFILDDLRGIAIITVLFYHYFFVYYKDKEIDNIFISNVQYLNDYINFGAFGISLFFLVSGFVIPMSLKGESNLKNLYNFFVKRFFRLYPTYWFSIILIIIATFIITGSMQYSFKQVLINFTMLQDIFRTQSIDGVFWTLLIELKFYVLTAILFYFNLLKYIKYIVLLLLSIATLYYGYTYQTGTYLGNGLWAYLMLMYLGTAFHFYHIKKIDKTVLFSLVLMVTVYYLLNFSYLPSSAYGDKFGYSIATTLAIVVFTIALKYKKSLSAITTFFGNISYSFYLIHQVVGYLFITLFINLSFNMPFGQINTFAIMIIFAFLIHKFIEKPSNKLGHKFVK